MTGFEVFEPSRRGRVPAVGLFARLSKTPQTVTLRITRDALNAIGINPKHGDHLYFLVEADRATESIRLTPTDDVYQGRMMNPMNRQINLGKRFVEWTGWGESTWELQAEDGALVGAVRVPLVGAEFADADA